MISNSKARLLEFSAIVAILAGFALFPSLPAIPVCPYAFLSGHACPTCGTTRSLWNILHGNFAAAFAFNPIGFIVAFVLIRRLAVLLLANNRILRILDGRYINAALLTLYLALGFAHYLESALAK
jgi:Protein of unknown function (DUF2752)